MITDETNINANTKPKKSKLQVLYKIYHFIAKVILYSLLIILFLVALLFALYFIDLQRNIKNGVSKQPLFGAYIIISPSMVPTINVEDAIIIQRKEENELKIGDIITFTSNDPRYSGLTITHRIVGIEKAKNGAVYFRTKGDNNNTEDDALVSYDSIYGKVILKIPKIGYIQYFLTRFYGWILLIVIPCLGVIIYDIIKVIKTVRNSFTGKKDNKKQKKELKNNEYIEIIEPKEIKQKTEKDSDDDTEII